jgi:hypothetical protein
MEWGLGGADGDFFWGDRMHSKCSRRWMGMAGQWDWWESRLVRAPGAEGGALAGAAKGGVCGCCACGCCQGTDLRCIHGQIRPISLVSQPLAPNPRRRVHGDLTSVEATLCAVNHEAQLCEGHSRGSCPGTGWARPQWPHQTRASGRPALALPAR